MRDRKDFFTLTYKERGKSFCFKRKGFIVLLITIVFFFFSSLYENRFARVNLRF